MDDHMHDRFLFEKEGFLYFGCINPFCMHGNLVLPNQFKVPLETKQLNMKLLSHKNRKIEIKITAIETGKTAIMTCDDNLKDCAYFFEHIISSLQ